jgi:integrase
VAVDTPLTGADGLSKPKPRRSRRNRGHPPTHGSLRHSFATLHLLGGQKPQWVQQQLGHSSIKLTVDTYGSWIRERNPAAADQLAAVVNGTVNGA